MKHGVARCGLISMVLLGAAGMPAWSQVINVDFQPGGAGGAASTNYAGQGAYADPGNNFWNAVAPSTGGNFNGSAGTGGTNDFAGDPFVSGFLNDSTGAATGVKVEVFKGDPDGAFAVSSSSGNFINLATDATELMSDYLISGFASNPLALNITGLDPTKAYDLYLYGAGDLDFRNTTFTVAGFGSQSTSGVPGGSHTLTLGQDYVVFSNITAPGTIIAIQFQNGGESDEGPFNGFQLVVVPEPSTAMLVGFAGLLGVGCLRKKTPERATLDLQRSTRKPSN